MSVVVGAAAVSGAGVLLWWSVAGDRRVKRRAAENLRTGLSSGDLDARQRALATPASERIVLPLSARLVERLVKLAPSGSVERLNQRILKAGMSSRWPVERTLATKVLLGALALPLGLLMLSGGSLFGVVYGLSLPPVAYFLPNLLLRAKARQRQQAVLLALPDTLDQITVCVEAGLGFDAALARAASTGTGPLAEELLRTMQDVQLGASRRDAMRGLWERNEVDDLRRFVQAIVQAEGYGVPIGRVLRIQAAELRDKRRQEAEERAQKVGIKMLFPLVTCILPTVFIVIMGPAIYRLADALGGGV